MNPYVNSNPITVLTDNEIFQHIQKERIKLEPFERAHLQAGKYDVHLGNKLLKPINPDFVVDPSDTNCRPPYEEIDIENEPYLLSPGEFVLGETVERLGLESDIAAIIDGRSSLARVGISIHQSSTYIPPGQDTHIITLEIFNGGIWKVKLSNLMRIGKLLFFKFSEKNAVDARSFNQYNGQNEVTGAIFDE